MLEPEQRPAISAIAANPLDMSLRVLYALQLRLLYTRYNTTHKNYGGYCMNRRRQAERFGLTLSIWHKTRN